MEENLVSSHLWSKFDSILDEAKGDHGIITSHFDSIRMSKSHITVEQLYELIEALSECIVYTYKRRTPLVSTRCFYFPPLIKLLRLVSKFNFNRKMKSRLQKIENKIQHNSGNSGLWSGRVVIQQTYPMLDPSPIIGFDAEADSVKAWLSEDSVRVIGIVGRSGCGKTALAQKVFASPEVVREFSPRIWVCLSNMLSRTDRVVHCMLEEINPTDSGNNLEDDMLTRLQNRLNGKKYLIVLDDLWCVDNWYAEELLSQTLPQGSGGSVIVTSRRENVMAHMVGDDNKHVIHLEELGDQICWQIFTTALDRNRSENENKLSEIKDDAKRIFDGLPLAAKTFGIVLRESLG